MRRGTGYQREQMKKLKRMGFSFVRFRSDNKVVMKHNTTGGEVVIAGTPGDRRDNANTMATVNQIATGTTTKHRVEHWVHIFKHLADKYGFDVNEGGVVTTSLRAEIREWMKAHPDYPATSEAIAVNTAARIQMIKTGRGKNPSTFAVPGIGASPQPPRKWTRAKVQTPEVVPVPDDEDDYVSADQPFEEDPVFGPERPAVEPIEEVVVSADEDQPTEEPVKDWEEATPVELVPAPEEPVEPIVTPSGLQLSKTHMDALRALFAEDAQRELQEVKAKLELALETSSELERHVTGMAQELGKMREQAWAVKKVLNELQDAIGG